MTLSDAELALIQNIHDRVEKGFESMQNQLLYFHTPDTCKQLKDHKKELDTVKKQQMYWTGGLAAIGSILVIFKDTITDFLKR